MTELSHAAQAVEAAAFAAFPENQQDHQLPNAIAAALRAAADQVASAHALYARSCCEFIGERTRASLLAIAAELDNTNHTSESD